MVIDRRGDPEADRLFRLIAEKMRAESPMRPHTRRRRGGPGGPMAGRGIGPG